MTTLLDRRGLLKLALATQAAYALGSLPSLAQDGKKAALKFGDAKPFSYDWLKAHAQALAGQAYREPSRPDPAIVEKIDYDAHGKLKYRNEFALYADGPATFPVTFMHVGRFFPKTVRMHAIEGGKAREILYDPGYFTVGADHVARGLKPQPSAFAGFWLREPKRTGTDWREAEPWVSFLGASYFRGIGELGQVGLSARGIAITPGGGGGPEEFPDFTAFWFEPTPPESDEATVYALLDGPSLTGAFRFVMQRGKGVVMDIENTLFLRKPVERLGIAPLTSMFWYSETVKPTAVDWRPEVHDSDGLAIWTGAGERIWRPLNNPGRIIVSSFADERPRGFGLLQRDRSFDNYQDGVRYHLRPSAWVEPAGDWGKGAVQLVELPTDDEIHDNIVAYWRPEKATAAGDRLGFRYKLHWLADEPYPTDLARCVATRLGNGGQPGQPRPKGVRKFMIEFKGGPLATLPYGVKPEPVLWASRGSFSYIFTEAVPNDVPGHWRAQFDLTVEGNEPVEMRCFLKAGNQTLSETWLYQYHPF